MKVRILTLTLLMLLCGAALADEDGYLYNGMVLAEKVGELISVHVIARPHVEVDNILPKSKPLAGGTE